jgi:N-acetylglucosamine-6-phosphate deacetylase
MKLKTILFTQVRLLGTEKSITTGWLLIKGNRISKFGSGEPPVEIRSSAEQIIEGKNCWLMPGFIDIHTHGAYGVDFVGADADGLQKVSKFLAAHGVTGFLVTTWSASPEQIIQTIETVKSVVGNEEGASILGIHLEGPFINPTRAGSQSPKDIRPAVESEVLAYLDSGLIRLVSLAPEITENHWLIKECAVRGITTSAGHTDATYAEMQTAVDLGVRQVTHTFNGMRGFNHREPGALGAALEMKQFSCEIIADKVHVHPAAIRLLIAAKGLDKVILVTDSLSGTGMPDGTFMMQGQRVHCVNGEARLQDGTLAGSLLTMDRALRNLVEITALPISECWICSSKNAAASIGLARQKGSIRSGSDADLVLLDSNLHVVKTIVQGNVVFER